VRHSSIMNYNGYLHIAELGSLQMDVAVPILGSAPCDKAAYHKGLKSVEQKLEVLDAHLRSQTFLVSPCQKCC
jgi:hypothetical protein